MADCKRYCLTSENDLSVEAFVALSRNTLAQEVYDAYQIGLMVGMMSERGELELDRDGNITLTKESR